MFLLYFVFVDQLELLKEGKDKAILDENEPVEDANMAEEDEQSNGNSRFCTYHYGIMVNACLV